MIETTQTVTVNAAIGDTWAYAKDVERWAEIMPGYQSCEIHDDDNSTWVLKIGVGAMVRTVTVNVTVDRWAGPEAVDFTFALKGDPVDGSGTYRAAANSPDATDVELAVQVNGSGPMAPMWEAMGGPVLPKFAKGFAEELKARIEAACGVAPVAAGETATKRSIWQRLVDWLRRLFG
jgi:carbon monoxide dehydrogenase subunit G